MPGQKKKAKSENSYAIHEQYMGILNSVPHAIYWIDTQCQLKGCNHAFVSLLGLKQLKDFNNTPYHQMVRSAHWDEKRVEQLKLDDMAVIFSGAMQHNRSEKPIIDKEGKERHFLATRTPMYDKSKNIIGLIVTLTEPTKVDEALEVMVAVDLSAPAKMVVEEGHLPNVLVIEDNLIAQCIEKELLTSLHCLVDIAESGDNALKLFNPGKYDLVLMDLGLEDTSGYVVAKKLRQMEQNTEFHVPIIALTAYNAEVVKTDCEHYFMEGAITKPLSTQQAEQIIQHYVYHQDVAVDGLKHT